MENKSDVKAIMARFQTGGANSTEETPSPSPGRLKTALHPTVSSGPPPQPKKPVLESLSSSTIPPKPTFLKSTNQSTKSAPGVRETPKTKALASMFANTQEDSNSNIKPLFANKAFPFKPPLSQDAEVKVPMPKPPLHKPSLSSTLPGSKPAFPKPPPGSPSNFKPPWVKEDSGGSLSTSSPTPPKVPPFQLKPASSVSKLCLKNEDVGGVNMDSTNKTFHKPDSTPNISNFRTTQSIFNKEREKPADPSDGDLKGGAVNKLPLSGSNSTPPDRPPPSKKPSFIRKMAASSTETNNISEDASLTPKRNPLPNSLALGPAPAKPNRPPRVNLEGLRGGTDVSNEGPGTSRKASFPFPPASHPSNHVTPSLTTQYPAPSLPPRHPGAIIQPDQDENYDDVGLMTSPPPPPPSAAHPSQRPKSQQEDESDEEMYEDLDERWDATDQKEQEKKRDKDEKEEKRRLELEKKEQKEREKKEQDARKKFKLSGPLLVIHKGTARVDSRGGKTDLSLRKGDEVHIIRVQGNPEGKWLGRTEDGSIGYVKTASVEIDFDSLKHQGSSVMTQQDYDPEVYDDIDFAPDNSDIKGLGVFLPPPPEEDDGEIYDDVVDPSLNISPSSPLERKSSPKSRGFLRMFEWRKPATTTNEVPPPSQFSAEGNSDQSAVDEEIYDDVDSQIVRPPPPLISSLTALKHKMEEMDPKKQKKFEKEERDFRKKFKYEGEIQVLYQVTIIPTLSNKKWSGKDLPIKPRESVDVIVKAMDNKLICRNEEGKFGYVSTSHIDMEDADIYDDIGDDCIYDND